MVVGMENFIHRFRDYSDCYTIIGGAACDILMTEADAEHIIPFKMYAWIDLRNRKFLEENPVFMRVASIFV